MASLGIVSLALLLLVLILALGGLMFRYHSYVESADLKRLYLYAISFVGLTIAAVALLLVVQDGTRILLGVDPAALGGTGALVPGRLDQPWDLSWRDSLSRWLGWFFAAAPIWAWTYRQAVKRSRARQVWTVHRFYLYAVAVLFLVLGIGFVAAMAAQGLRVLLGLVDLNNQLAVRELWHGVVRGLVDGGICGVLWWTHYRAISHSAAGDHSAAA